jgi:hypothetical protein
MINMFSLTIFRLFWACDFLPLIKELSRLSSVLSVGTFEPLPAICSTRLCLASVFYCSLASRRYNKSCSLLTRASSFYYFFYNSRYSLSNALRRAFSFNSAINFVCLLSRQGPHSQIFP